MKRESMLHRLAMQSSPWDVIIIGGGATGLGAALDSVTRGFRTLLVESVDFAKGTSSRSTKLIHGGLRYLQQGNIHLVMEALHERGVLRKNAPHLVHSQSFLLPCYKYWEIPFYGFGLKAYDLLAGKLGLQKSSILSKSEISSLCPNLSHHSLKGACEYYDGQFDDSRLAITLAATAAEFGACLLNYMEAVGFIKKNGKIVGIKIKDTLSGSTMEIPGVAFINATGPFLDTIREMDSGIPSKLISPSQGIHLVLPRSFLGSSSAILIPKTEDGRVIFLVPWHDHVILGTTDTEVSKIVLEPKPLEEEIDFLLRHAAHILTKAPKRIDVLSVFTGLRPLVKPPKSEKTSAISRDHSIFIDDSGLISIAGGKWTTYRKMGQDVIDRAILTCDFPRRNSITSTIPLKGATTVAPKNPQLKQYGRDAEKIMAMIEKDPHLGNKLHPELPYIWAELKWAIDHEMAETIEDLLSRRTRALLLNAKATRTIAKEVAEWMAKEKGKDHEWIQKQLANFDEVSKIYVID